MEGGRGGEGGKEAILLSFSVTAVNDDNGSTISDE